MTWLIADIGGTNARFALYDEGCIQNAVTLKARDYPTLEGAIKAYLEGQNITPRKAVFAVASAVLPHEKIHFLNHPAWDFDPSELQKNLGFTGLHLMNDFEAIACGLFDVTADDLLTVIPNQSVLQKPRLALGAGTGLGVATAFLDDRQKLNVLASEGGYVTLPALTDHDLAIFEWLKSDLNIPHISAERLLSGEGLLNIYRALSAQKNLTPLLLSPEEITKAAEENDATALETFHFFCRYLGVIAGNAALTTGAFGGVYLTGNILSSHQTLLTQSSFTDFFQHKGRGTFYLKDIPVHLITAPYPAFIGLKRFISDQ
jgi:glucokinase